MTAVEFQRRILRRKLWSEQNHIATLLETHRSVSVKACHASGKTFTAAGLALEFVARDERAKVLWIAPTLRQVKLGIDEVALAAGRSAIRFPEMSMTGMRISEENYIQGFSAGRGINAQGFHGAKVLIIADEAPGIQGDVWDAIEGIRSGGDVRLLKLGNPTIPGGPFFDDFGVGKSFVQNITISAFDTPNFEGLSIENILYMDDADLDVVKSPFLIRRRWVREMYRKWGPDHPNYQSRVLGQFPAQSKYSVFPAASVQLAARPLEERHIQDLARYEGIVQVGVDVAGAGDDETAACARIGQLVVAADAWPDADARGQVGRFLTKIKQRFPKCRMVVVVDMIGVGHYMGKWIADQGFEVVGFIASGKPRDASAFLNAKAEAYFCLAEWMKRGIYGVEDEDTKGQLIGCQWQTMPTGIQKIEDKDDMKKRGLSSPDRAEALVMAFLPLVPLQQRLVYNAA